MNIKLLLKIILIIFIPALSFATHDPLKIAHNWAKAAKERNGKKQYQLLCKDLQNKNRANLESTNWVTGVSSPRIGNYKITKLPQKKGSTNVLVKYQIILQNKVEGSVSDILKIKNGCIAEFKYLSPTEEEPSK